MNSPNDHLGGTPKRHLMFPAQRQKVGVVEVLMMWKGVAQILICVGTSHHNLESEGKNVPWSPLQKLKQLPAHLEKVNNLSHQHWLCIAKALLTIHLGDRKLFPKASPTCVYVDDLLTANTTLNPVVYSYRNIIIVVFISGLSLSPMHFAILKQSLRHRHFTTIVTSNTSEVKSKVENTHT